MNPKILQTNQSPILALVSNGESKWKKLNRFEGSGDSLLSEQGHKESIQGGELLKEGGYKFDVYYTSTSDLLDEVDQRNPAKEISYFKEVIIPDLKSGKNVLVSAHGDTFRSIVKYLDNLSEQEFIELKIPNAIPLVYEFDNDLRPKKSYYLSFHETINDKVKTFYYYEPDIKIVFAEKMNKKQGNAVWEILKKTNNDFVPPLTERVDSVHDITPEEQGKPPEKKEKDEKEPEPVKVYEDIKDNTFIFIVKDGNIEGFFSFKKDYPLEINKETIICDYIIAVIIDPNCRNRGYAKKVYNILLNERKEKKIATRTWSTNFAHMHILDKLGFELVQRILNNRGPNIDTVYYLKKPKKNS